MGISGSRAGESSEIPRFCWRFSGLRGLSSFTVEGLRNEVVGFKGVVFRFCGRFVFFKCIKAGLIFFAYEAVN